MKSKVGVESMRKFLIPFLMATTLVPAAVNAEPGDRGGRDHRERSESNDNKSNDRPQRVHVERSNNDAPRIHVDRSAQVERNVEGRTSEPVRVRRFEGRNQAQQVQQVEQVRRTNRD